MDLGPRVWGENERGSSGRSRAGHEEGEGKGEKKRESDLNAVGPKNHQLGLDRSDRSPIPVRPVRARLTKRLLTYGFPI